MLLGVSGKKASRIHVQGVAEYSRIYRWGSQLQVSPNMTSRKQLKLNEICREDKCYLITVLIRIEFWAQQHTKDGQAQSVERRSPSF